MALLADRVACVTASTKGIGFAIARRLGLDGASVVVCSRKQKNVDEAVAALRSDGVNVHGVAAHVAVRADRARLFQQTVDKFGQLDVLISNAAVNPAYGSIFDVTDAQWDKLFQVNVRASWQLACEAVPYLEKSKSPSIVFVSSVAGLQTIDGLGAYSVTKAALLGLSKCMAQALAAGNEEPRIRVNAVAPGIIRTDFSRALYEDEAKKAEFEKQVALGRLGSADEVADAVSFLASDAATYISGETLSVTGGIRARV